MGKTKTKKGQNILKNPIEAIQGYGSDAVSSVAETATNQIDTLFVDLLGLGSSSESQNKENNGEIELFSRAKEQKAETGHIRAHIEYHDEIRKVGERASHAETKQLTRQVQEILMELKKLISSSKTMEMEFADIAVMETPPEVGEYHLSFFDWLLITIKQAREKVEDSGAWLAAVKGKNSKKGGGYWDMFKKHGTSFGMSNERSTATSVG